MTPNDVENHARLNMEKRVKVARFVNRLERMKDRLAEILDNKPSGPEREFIEWFLTDWHAATGADFARAEEIIQNRA